MPTKLPNKKAKYNAMRSEKKQLDPEEIIEDAKQLLAIPDDDDSGKHPQFPGASVKTGNMINYITALRIGGGYWDKEIADALKILPSQINRLEHRYPNEFAQAEQAALTMASQKLEANIYRVRAAAARRAPEMLEILFEIASDKEIPPNVRRDCARDWLNLIGMNMPVGRGGSQNQLNKGTLVAIQQVFGKNEGVNTDVIESEVLDD